MNPATQLEIVRPESRNGSPEGDRPGVTPPSGRPGTRFLSDVIVELGFAERPRVEAAVQAARTPGKTLGGHLVETGELTQDQLARAIAERYGLDHIDLDVFEVEAAAAGLIGPAASSRYEAMPVAFVDERTLLVAMADPADWLAADDIASVTGLDVRPAVATRDHIQALVARLPELAEQAREQQALLPETPAPSLPDAPSADAQGEVDDTTASTDASEARLAAVAAELDSAREAAEAHRLEIASARAELEEAARARVELEEARAEAERVRLEVEQA
ncbi:MAG: hypothetical protein H0V85_03385, partial [Thermoleophilaceae bacterium]|nr:hypothetical protein [Thermoleophilaceae bacterium]